MSKDKFKLSCPRFKPVFQYKLSIVNSFKHLLIINLLFNAPAIVLQEISVQIWMKTSRKPGRDTLTTASLLVWSDLVGGGDF